MEFRCRLGTPGGEIIEGVYVADSEARLSREFEEKGLFVLGLQRAGRSRLGALALPQRTRVSTREFVVFNQELATLLKAGMPLVQSLDILRRRVSNPVFKVGARRRERAGAGGKLAVRGVRGARHRCFPGVYTASILAGEKSGNLEQVIRRYVAYVKVVAQRQAADGVGAGLPGDPARAVARRRVDHHAAGGAGVRRVLRAVRPGAAAVDPGHRRGVVVCRRVRPGAS